MSTKFSLGIDTSGTAGSVALLPDDPDATALLVPLGEGLIHGVSLAPTVARLLEQAGLVAGDLSLIVVGLGPGSYTGVRVGVSFAKTLAFAAGVPVVGVSSLEAVARNGDGTRPVVCARDARRETLYVATWVPGDGGLEEAHPLSLMSLDEVPAVLPDGALVLGDAVERYPDLLSGGGRVVGDRELWNARADVVATIGREILARDGEEDPHDLAPIYLRPSEAEERWAERNRERGG